MRPLVEPAIVHAMIEGLVGFLVSPPYYRIMLNTHQLASDQRSSISGLNYAEGERVEITFTYSRT